MNNEIKVSVTVVLPGRTMITQQVAANKPENYNEFSMEVSEAKGNDKSVIKVRTRKSIPATQSINLTKDAYDAMTSNECPYWSKPREWSERGKKGRLDAHIHRIAEQLGGIKYSYIVFED